MAKLEENKTLAVHPVQHPVSAVVMRSVASNKFPLHTSSPVEIGWADPISTLLLTRILVLIVGRPTTPPVMFVFFYAQRRSFCIVGIIVGISIKY